MTTLPTADALRRARQLALLVFLQMLPATLLTPAIRPLFAELHGGREGAMHAFMALNMLGGLLAAPWLGSLADRLHNPRRLLAGLAAVDAVLLGLMTAPLPTALVLGLRTLEGAAHVGGATLLLAEAAALGRRFGDGRAMGLAGAAIMMAIAFGSALGGVGVAFGYRVPFWGAAALSSSVAAAALSLGSGGHPSSALAARRVRGFRDLGTALLVPVSAAFVERFTVGCLVVTFALFGHHQHGLTDAAIGFLFACFTLPFALLTYPAGRLSDHVPRSGLLAAGALLYGAALAVLGHVPAGGLAWVMGAAGSASALLYAPTLCYAATAAGPEGRGRSMALVNAAGCLGMLLGPAAAGVASAVFQTPADPVRGYRAAFLLAGATSLVWLAGSARWLAARFRAELSAPPRAPELAPGLHSGATPSGRVTAPPGSARPVAT